MDVSVNACVHVCVYMCMCMCVYLYKIQVNFGWPLPGLKLDGCAKQAAQQALGSLLSPPSHASATMPDLGGSFCGQISGPHAYMTSTLVTESFLQFHVPISNPFI